MRAITGGSVVLAFAVVLLSWDVSRRFAHVSPAPRISLFAAGDSAVLLSAPRIQAHSALALQVPGSDSTASSPTAATSTTSTQPTGSMTQPAPAAQQGNPAQRRLAEGSGLPVRQLTPGSKAHVDALATAIDSEESRNTVAPLARLYFAFFDRFSDYEGLNYYIDERNGGVSLESIADEFAGSTEFNLRYGALDNAAFIDRMFRNVFDMPPDAAQRAFWIAQLESGTTRGQVLIAFSESGAFRAATSNEVFVTMAYAEALRREPDPAGFVRWVRFLDAGNPREAVIAGLLGEARLKNGVGVDLP